MNVERVPPKFWFNQRMRWRSPRSEFILILESGECLYRVGKSPDGFYLVLDERLPSVGISSYPTKCDQEVRPVDFSPRLNLEGGANANNRSDHTVYYRKTEHLRWLDDYFDCLDDFLYVVLVANYSSYGTFSFLREKTTRPRKRQKIT
jgi:hypothetical protein